MPLFRSFSKPSHFTKWFEATPALSALVDCLGINTNKPSSQNISVFDTNSFSDELEVQAALTQRDRSSAERKYGIRIDLRDCRAAGVTVHYDGHGETGIPFVDLKHVTLYGTRDQFRQLMGSSMLRLSSGTE